MVPVSYLPGRHVLSGKRHSVRSFVLSVAAILWMIQPLALWGDIISSGDKGDTLEVIDNTSKASLCVVGPHAGFNGDPESIFCEIGDVNDPRIGVVHVNSLLLVETGTTTPSDVLDWTVGQDANGNVFYVRLDFASDPSIPAGFLGTGVDESKYYTPQDVSSMVFAFLPAGKAAPYSVLISSDADTGAETPEPAGVGLFGSLIAVIAVVGRTKLARWLRAR
jgi:hypothetical protein